MHGWLVLNLGPLPTAPGCRTGLITVPANVVGMPAWMAAASLNAYGGSFTAADIEKMQVEVSY